MRDDEALDCWDDYPMPHGCVCGNDCEPPAREQAHDWDRMLICRKCGQGMNAGDLIDGARPCIARKHPECPR